MVFSVQSKSIAIASGAEKGKSNMMAPWPSISAMQVPILIICCVVCRLSDEVSYSDTENK